MVKIVLKKNGKITPIGQDFIDHWRREKEAEAKAKRKKRAKKRPVKTTSKGSKSDG